MRIVAVIALAVLLGVAGAGGLLVRGTELPWLGDLLADRVGAELGRPVHLSQAPYVRIGSDLRIRLRGISVDNAAWAGAQPLAELAEADVVVRTRSLFTDAPVHLRHVSLDGLRLRLVRGETGISNLPAALTDPAESRDEPETVPQEERPGLPFLLGELTISDVLIERDNRERDTRQTLTIASLTQLENDDDELLIDARGTLQDQAWSLQGAHSGLHSLASGRDLHGVATAALADLSLEFDYRLADLRKIEDLSLTAFLHGTPPPRIAELSPLLSVDQPISLNATVSDIDPGIGIEAVLDLGGTELRMSGSADDPGSGDGLDLSIDADASSLAQLAQALNLGPTDDVGLTIDGHVRRHGRSLQVEGLKLVADGHRLEGEVFLPLLPGTSDGRLTLTASGPDFGFYQRLFKRPFAIDAPYSAQVELSATGDGRESLQAELQIGAAEVHADGRLGDFPSYLNTQLRLTGRAEDLSVIGRSFDLPLPAIELSVQGDIDVTDEGRVRLANTRIDAAGVSATLDGGMDTYPELDDIDLRFSARTPSLGSSSLRLGGPALGAVPMTLTADIGGSATDLVIANIVSRTGASRVQTLGGGLHLTGDGPRSDLRLAVQIERLSELLGEAGGFAAPAEAADDTSGPLDESTAQARQTPDPSTVSSGGEPRSPRRLRDRPFSFELVTELTANRLGLSVTRLEGDGISGSVEWRSANDFAPDESMHLSADLQLTDLERLLPPIGGYTPPRGTLTLRADTSVVPKRISAQLAAGGSELLSIDFTPRSNRSRAKMQIRGAGDDLRRLGSIEALPDGPLPFRVQATVTENENDWLLAVEELSIGGSTIADSRLAADKASGALTAAINVPQANLAAWLPERTAKAPAPDPRKDDAQPDAPPESKRQARLIRATPLPLEILNGRPLDLSLRTGSLGWPDPQFPDRSVIERSELSLQSGDGRVRLDVRELRGSRGNLVLEASGERADRGAAVATRFNLEGLPIGILTSDLDPAKLPQHKIDGTFTGRGETLRDLAATLNGQLLLTGTGGELKNLNIRLLTDSFFAQLFSTLLPVLNNDTPSLKVECSVLALRARDGLVALDPGFVIRTDRVDLSARGSVNLATERLKIRFDNQARRGLGISAASLVNPYVQVTGTLADPYIGLDVASSAVAGGAAWATGGLTVLAKPLFGRFLPRKSPCKIALERWEKTSPAPGGS